MINYALNFMKEIGFDEDAIASLHNDIKKIYENGAAKDLFEECISLYENDIFTDFPSLLSKAAEAGALANVHEYSAHMLILVCMTKHLRDEYRKNGMPDDIFFASVSDLKWKLWECKAVKNVWGIFVAPWENRFFNMTRFALGRLQFEISPLKKDFTIRETIFKAGSKAIFVHIPRTLTPLTRESMLDGYRKAYEMLKEQFGEQPVIFGCNTWLFSDELPTLLGERSNLRKFIEDFDIVERYTHDKGNFPDAWRLFDMDFTGNIDDYPEDTSLRRAYKAHLKSGGTMGGGIGFFLAKDVLAI